MAIIERPIGMLPARLTDDALRVEAGTTVETTLVIDPPSPGTTREGRTYHFQVQGVPRGWVSLARDQLTLADGESGAVLIVFHPPHHASGDSLGEYEFAVTVQADGEGGGSALPGRLLVLAPGAATRRSRYTQYLPSVYQDDLFLARFLLIFQSLLDPIEQNVDNTHYYLDPGVTPPAFLPWLASWVGVTLDPGLDEASQRELIRRAVELSRWKGTRRGLREEIKIRTGARSLIVENFDGMRVGQDAALGLNTHLGVRREGGIAVTLVASPGVPLSQSQADSLVQEIKPAHVGHVVRLTGAPPPLRTPSEGVNRG